MSRTTSRRNFLGGLGAALGAGALLGPQLGCPSEETSTAPPTRLLIIHKPCGTVPQAYDCAGGERDYVLSPILEPLEAFRSQMVILDGLDIRNKENTPAQDHGNGMVTFMTGGSTITADGFGAAIADRASIDHILAHDPAIAGDVPLRSLQLAADIRSDRDEVFTRVLSYSGRAAPVLPEQRPAAAFARVFGGLMDGGLDATSQLGLEHARARRQSVLDFSRQGLQRLSARVGAADRQRLESHLGAIRELELLLDSSSACSQREELARSVQSFDTQAPGGLDNQQLDAQHGDIGLAHLNIARTAFQCDLTRIATFSWAAGNSHVNFSRLIDGVEDRAHHSITHRGGNRAHDEAAIHRWYNERLATFLASMQATPDSDGNSLLDNTLVVVWSEIRLGVHTFESVPIQLFGGAGGRLQGDRLLRFDGRSTNDLWVAIANALGHPLHTFGDPERSDGPLSGIFRAV